MAVKGSQELHPKNFSTYITRLAHLTSSHFFSSYITTHYIMQPHPQGAGLLDGRGKPPLIVYKGELLKMKTVNGSLCTLSRSWS